jgi:hypothetical protein
MEITAEAKFIVPDWRIKLTPAVPVRQAIYPMQKLNLGPQSETMILVTANEA